MFVTKGTEKMERSEIGNEMARMYGEGRKREREKKQENKGTRNKKEEAPTEECRGQERERKDTRRNKGDDNAKLGRGGVIMLVERDEEIGREEEANERTNERGQERREKLWR